MDATTISTTERISSLEAALDHLLQTIQAIFKVNNNDIDVQLDFKFHAKRLSNNESNSSSERAWCRLEGSIKDSYDATLSPKSLGDIATEFGKMALELANVVAKEISNVEPHDAMKRRVLELHNQFWELQELAEDIVDLVTRA